MKRFRPFCPLVANLMCKERSFGFGAVIPATFTASKTRTTAGLKTVTAGGKRTNVDHACNEKAQAGLFGWDLQLGALDPVDELSGVQSRLANLGYYNGPVDGAQNDDLSLAVARFQGDEKLAVSGDIDDDTRDALRQRHDGA